MFVRGVSWIIPVQRIGINKDGARLFEGDTMFFEVGDGLRDVPCDTLSYIRSCALGRKPQGGDGNAPCSSGREAPGVEIADDQNVAYDVHA